MQAPPPPPPPILAALPYARRSAAAPGCARRTSGCSRWCSRRRAAKPQSPPRRALLRASRCLRCSLGRRRCWRAARAASVATPPPSSPTAPAARRCWYLPGPQRSRQPGQHAGAAGAAGFAVRGPGRMIKFTTVFIHKLHGHGRHDALDGQLSALHAAEVHEADVGRRL